MPRLDSPETSGFSPLDNGRSGNVGSVRSKLCLAALAVNVEVSLIEV